MTTHWHSDEAWRVRVDDTRGTPRGAGVLLDSQHVLTCAHVIRQANAGPGGAASQVKITSAVCRPEWQRSARVVPDSWVYRNQTRRGDVALLELDSPTPCGASTTLWRVPLSGGRVHAYGFPGADAYGIEVAAELAGSGGREGEWRLLNPVRDSAQWIEPGFSGAGVVASAGEFQGRVIGIVVRDYVNAGAHAAWMLPTDTMLHHLPRLEPYVRGAPAAILPSPAGAPAEEGLRDPLRLALTQELTRLLSGGWSGTVVLTGGASGTGTSWLSRLVSTADPAARAGVSDIELSRAPQDTVLRLGAVDAAYDARGRSLADVGRYLADRFGFPADQHDLLHRLLHRAPPVCLVIAAVDRADDPARLMDELLAPLAFRARSRGIRLVLGCDGGPPPGLSYEVSLGPVSIAGPVQGRASGTEAAQHVARLSAAEDTAAALHAEWGMRFARPPRYPRSLAPQLRVQLAVARATAQSWQFALIRDRATAACREVEQFERELSGRVAQYKDLLSLLELNRKRAERRFGAEDLALMAPYTAALRTLSNPPVKMEAARSAVDRYMHEVNRRVEDERARDPM